MGGESAQVVTFVVPATERRVAAWYAWWVGRDSGRVLREAMVSRWHYMFSEFRDFDEPIAIEVPITAGPGTPSEQRVRGQQEVPSG